MYVPFLENTFVRFWGGGYGVTTPISGRKSTVSFVGLFHPYIISKVYVISPRLIVLDFGGLLSRVSFLTGTRGPVAPIAHRFAPRDISDCECSKRGLRRPERQDLRFSYVFVLRAMEDGLFPSRGWNARYFLDVQNDFPNHSVHQTKTWWACEIKKNDDSVRWF